MIYPLCLDVRIFNYDAQQMIIDPLDKTILILKRLSSQYFAANYASHTNQEKDGGAALVNVEEYIDEIANAFHVDADEDLHLEVDLVDDGVNPTAQTVMSHASVLSESWGPVEAIDSFDAVLAHKVCICCYNL